MKMNMKKRIMVSMTIILVVSVIVLSIHAYTLQTRVIFLEGAKESLEVNLSSVNASVMELRTSLLSLETTIGVNFDSLNATIIALQSGFEADIADIQTSILELQSRIDNTNASLQAQIDSLNASLIELQSQMNNRQHGTITIPDEIGLYTLPTGGIEVSHIDWTIASGQTQSVTYYLRNKSLPSTMVWMSWTTSGTLPSYLHLSMNWNGPEPWLENARRAWNPWDNVSLAFILTSDLDAPIGAVSFNQLFEVHNSP